MERRRTLGSEAIEMEKEWKLLKTLASSDVNSNNEISITTDNDGNPFSVNEIYMRIYKCERQVASYNGISIEKNKSIGELRGNFPMEVFIKNVAGFWRCFYIPYGGTYSPGTLTSWGAFHTGFAVTKEDVPEIKVINIGYVKSIEAEIYGR
jgi:hypothetical protein